jgi:small subunit ribosomal protein S20
LFFKEHFMANHPSALKRMRQSEKKRLRNLSYRSSVRTAVKKFLQAVDQKSSDAPDLFRKASSVLAKGVAKGVFHKNTASRKISNLAGKLSTT